MSDPQITQLLGRVRAGDDAAEQELLPLIYADLHARAAALMRSERSDATLQPTALVHEAWLRLQKSPGESDWSSRRHFLGLAARVMRNVLVDRARRRRATEELDLERDGIAVRAGSAAAVGGGEGLDMVDVLDLHAAMERLRERDPELERIVELRFFAGMTLQEVADTFGKSLTSVHRGWELARSFLQRELLRGE
ncbi:MAG: ECF-type sigma factor [Planctomycetota bacterium]